MDGLTMLYQLRQKSTTVPVIVMSADPARSTMIKAIEGGARVFCSRPAPNKFSSTKVFVFFSSTLCGLPYLREMS